MQFFSRTFICLGGLPFLRQRYRGVLQTLLSLIIRLTVVIDNLPKVDQGVRRALYMLPLSQPSRYITTMPVR
jgi:hypothetical protein